MAINKGFRNYLINATTKIQKRISLDEVKQMRRREHSNTTKTTKCQELLHSFQ
jgi:hypothetical protein